VPDSPKGGRPALLDGKLLSAAQRGKLFSLAAIFLIPDKHFPKKGMEKSWAGETKNGR